MELAVSVSSVCSCSNFLKYTIQCRVRRIQRYQNQPRGNTGKKIWGRKIKSSGICTRSFKRRFFCPLIFLPFLWVAGEARAGSFVVIHFFFWFSAPSRGRDQ